MNPEREGTAPGFLRAAKGFLVELQRRRVFRVAGVYIVVGWIVIQVAVDVFPALQLPAWSVTLVVVLTGLGFLVALFFGWAFDLTPDGVTRTESRSRGSQAGRRAADMTRSAAPRLFRSRSRGVHATVPPGSNAANPAEGGAPGAVTMPAESVPPSPERVRRAYTASVRHELRTPINAIVGYSEMLLEDELEAADRDRVARVRDAGRALLELVDRELRAAEGESEVARPLEGLENTLQPGIDDILALSDQVIERAGDAGEERLVADLQRVQDAARQLRRLSREVAAALAGDADPDGLARFGNLTSVARQVLSKIRPVDREPGEEVHEGRLLVVDDNAINRNLLSRQLARHGYSVLVAKDGVEALELLAEHEVDLILLDLLMPVLDGFEVLRRIKADDRLREIPVMMLTALDEIDTLVRCIEIGAEDYLPKPFDSVLLRTRIEANLEVGRLRAERAAFTHQLEAERAFSEELLMRLAPPLLVERIRSGATVEPEFLPDATVLSADLEGVNRLVGQGRADDVIAATAANFSAFDRVAAELSVRLTRVTGHSYLAIAGDGAGELDHAAAAADLAVAMIAETARYAAESGELFRLRIGLHTGPVVVGVLDTGRISQEAWGEAVTVATYLKMSAPPGSIQVSPSTYARLRGRYDLAIGDLLEVPNLGQIRAHLLLGVPLGAAELPGPDRRR